MDRITPSEVILLKVRRSRRISLLSLATEKHLVARAVDLYPVTTIPLLDGYDITGAEQNDFPLVRRISASFGRRCPALSLHPSAAYRQQNLSNAQGADRRRFLAGCAQSLCKDRSRIGTAATDDLGKGLGQSAQAIPSALIPMRTK